MGGPEHPQTRPWRPGITTCRARKAPWKWALQDEQVLGGKREEGHWGQRREGRCVKGTARGLAGQGHSQGQGRRAGCHQPLPQSQAHALPWQQPPGKAPCPRCGPVRPSEESQRGQMGAGGPRTSATSFLRLLWLGTSAWAERVTGRHALYFSGSFHLQPSEAFASAA